MNGGNISDGPKGRSGNVIDIKGALNPRAKIAPPDVNEGAPAGEATADVRPAHVQLAALKKRYDADTAKWLRDTNHLSDKLRHVREAAKHAISGMREMYEKNVGELINARAKFDKYLNLSMEQEDKIERLEKELKTWRKNVP